MAKYITSYKGHMYHRNDCQSIKTNFQQVNLADDPRLLNSSRKEYKRTSNDRRLDPESLKSSSRHYAGWLRKNQFE